MATTGRPVSCAALHMRHDGWDELVNDEGGLLIPMMMPHDDPEIGPQPSPPALPLKIFFNMRRVELQLPGSGTAITVGLVHTGRRVAIQIFPVVNGTGTGSGTHCG
jgi:hypothetical protein